MDSIKGLFKGIAGLISLIMFLMMMSNAKKPVRALHEINPWIFPIMGLITLGTMWYLINEGKNK